MHNEMFSFFSLPTKLLLYLWTRHRRSNMDAELLLAEMLMSVCGPDKRQMHSCLKTY